LINVIDLFYFIVNTMQLLRKLICLHDLLVTPFKEQHTMGIVIAVPVGLLVEEAPNSDCEYRPNRFFIDF